MASYANTSPWHNTPINQDFLDILSIRPVAAEADDFVYVIESQYNHRPDLLSFDLYGTPRLWWVFTQRNMDILQDPIYDFRAGVEIYIPKQSGLFKVLGL
jgi:alpha-L-fucosidase